MCEVTKENNQRGCCKSESINTHTIYICVSNLYLVLMKQIADKAMERGVTGELLYYNTIL